MRDKGYSLLTRQQQVNFWAFVAGLDLLPAVNDAQGLRRIHGVRGSSETRNGWLGATPSDISSDGKRCYPLLAWQHRHTHMREVQRWLPDDQLNLLLHTRTIRAIQLEGGRNTWAQHVQQEIFTYLGRELPWVWHGRHRGARAMFFRTSPHIPLTGSLICTTGSPRRIRFCADGDTVPVVGIAEGEGAGEILPRGFEELDPFPCIPIEILIGLWDHLRGLYGHGSPIGQSQTIKFLLESLDPLANDDLYQWLKHKGRVIGRSPEGYPLIVCPWHYHINTRSTNKPASYIPATLTTPPHIVCTHPNCLNRTLTEYMDKYGYYK